MVDRRIERFIASQHLLTLATVAEGQPWCSNLFYAFDSQRMRLIFTSSVDTLHIEQAVASPAVACSIVGSSRIVGRLRGAQITGRVVEPRPDEVATCRGAFLARFPFAALSLDKLWIVEIETIKYTDNTLGFGTKLFYKIKK